MDLLFMGEETSRPKYWVVPQQGGLLLRDGYTLKEFLSQAGYQLESSGVEEFVSKDMHNLAHLHSDTEEFHVGSDMHRTQDYSLKRVEATLNFIDLLGANSIPYSERFNRDCIITAMESNIEKANNLISRLKGEEVENKD